MSSSTWISVYLINMRKSSLILSLIEHKGCYLLAWGFGARVWRDEVPLPAPFNFHCHQLRLHQGIIALVGHSAFRYSPIHSLGMHLSNDVLIIGEALQLFKYQVPILCLIIAITQTMLRFEFVVISAISSSKACRWYSYFSINSSSARSFS